MTTDAADGTPRATLLISGRPAIDLTTPVTVGRDPRLGEGEVVVVDGDPLVSKSHLRIDRDASGFVVIDLGSSNGTFLHHLGQERAVPTDSWTPLPLGAQVEFGDQRLTIDVQAVPDASSLDDAATPERGIVAPVPPVAPSDPWGAGREASALIACTNCGRALEAGSRFCDGCGTPTVPVAAVAPPVQPAPPASPAGTDPNATVAVPATALPLAGGAVSSPAPLGSAAPVDPDQPGGPVFVDLSGSSDSAGGRWKLVVAVVAAIVVVAVVGVIGAMAFGGGDDRSDAGATIVVPERVERLWSESVEDVFAWHVDDDGVYVATGDFDAQRVDVLAFDRGSGEELWNVTVDPVGSFIDVTGATGVLVVNVCDTTCVAVGLDTATGDQLWSEQLGQELGPATDEFAWAVDDGATEFVDLLTGDRIERVRGDEVRIRGERIEISDGDDVEVFDLELNSVLGPEPIDEADAVAFDGDLLVIAEGDELRFVDADGTVVAESSVDVGLIVEIEPVADDNIVLYSDEGVISIDPVDGTADERWSERGELIAVAEVDGGPVVLVGTEGSIQVIDADTGDRRFDVQADWPDNSFAVPGRNLLVVYRFESFDEPTEIAAYDWETGDEVWQERFDSFSIVDGGLVIEITNDGDVVAYG